jgi:transcriptional regulator with XRE-family HTH domain
MYYRLVSYKEVAARLKVARLEKGWTGVQAAEVAQMAQPEVSRIENGKERFFTAAMQAKTERLAKALGVNDLRWEPADDAEMIREEAREVAESVMTDGIRARRDRMEQFFRKGGSADVKEKVLNLIDLHHEGVLSHDALVASIETTVMNAP